MNVVAHASMAILCIVGTQHARSTPLAGSWQSADKSNTSTFRRDGTGSNSDGSRFHWRIEKNRLVFRPVAANGTIGKAGSTPIEFTHDKREFALIYEGGKLRAVFYLLTKSGVRYSNRSALDRQYPKAASLQGGSSDDDAPIPSTREQKKPPPYLVGPNIQVSKAKADIPHSEVVIAADPTNPNRLVAGAMPASPHLSRVAIYASEDSGRSWSLSYERKGMDPEVYADPAFAAGSDGAIYFVNMYFKDFGSVGGESLQFIRRSPGSMTWTPALSESGLHDRPFLAIDNTGGPFRGRLYCMTNNGLYVSRDDGESFSPAAPFSAKAGFHYTGPSDPVVLSDGSLITVQNSWTDQDVKSTASRRKSNSKFADRSDDDYERTEREHEVGGRDIFQPGERKVGGASSMAGLFTARCSIDGGQTLSSEHAIASYDFNHLSYSNVPVLAVDTSTSHRDRLYVAWNDALPSGGTGIFFAQSEDRGTTWSRPMLLSEQAPELIRDLRKWPSMEKYTGYLPCIAVNSAGVVGVSWYDNRGLPAGEAGWNYRFRASLDGGKTWEPSIRISEKTTLFAMKSRSASQLEKRRARYHAGHTSGLCSDANGVFHALWIDARTGVRQVWTATITMQRT